jgi:PIN domain nuclease of toxin-antitoxin system
VKLLLDTHIWLWSALDPSRLSRRVADALENPANELWLSPISVWEALMLAERGRVALEPNGPQWVQETLDAIPMREAPINHAVAFESRRLRAGPKDPADRFLAATARVYELTLVTADRRLAAAPGVVAIRNK